MIWRNLEYLNLLWALLLFVALHIYASYRRRHALSSFADTTMAARLNAVCSPYARMLKAILRIMALALLIVAMARPCWHPVSREVHRKGRDVVFVLDISRSMLADDLQPNRLERAKIAIGDCLDVLEGDRIALVLFAGSSMVKCPLTVDYGFFRLMLSDVEPRSVGRGGTKIGDALRMVQNTVLDNQERQCRDVILITDGEDQDSFAVEAAAALGKEGVRILAVGLGNENEGTPILAKDEDGKRDFIKDKAGNVVRSRLDGETLRKMAAATPGGRYLPVATGNFDLGGIYRSLVASAEKQSLEAETIQRYEEKYQIFLIGVLILLFAAELVRERRS